MEKQKPEIIKRIEEKQDYFRKEEEAQAKWFLAERSHFSKQTSQMKLALFSEWWSEYVDRLARRLPSDSTYQYDGLFAHYYFFFNDENFEKIGGELFFKVLGKFYWELEKTILAKRNNLIKWNAQKYITEKYPTPESESDLVYWGMYLGYLESSTETLKLLRTSVEVNIQNFGLKIKKSVKPNPTNKYNFSIFDWATIFHFTDRQNLSFGKTLADKRQFFFETYSIKTTIKNFDNERSEVKKRLKDGTYPIDKLQFLKPFLTANYPAVVETVQNEIDFLKEEKRLK